MGDLRIEAWLNASMQRLEQLENRVFGPGNAPIVDDAPEGRPSSNPGTIGLDAVGNVVIEPLAGRRVLVSNRDIVLLMHQNAVRAANLKTAMTACPCLARNTCLPVCPASFTVFFPWHFSFFLLF